MQVRDFLRARFTRGARRARRSLARASAHTTAALSLAAAYRRAYFISRDFRTLLG